MAGVRAILFMVSWQEALPTTISNGRPFPPQHPPRTNYLPERARTYRSYKLILHPYAQLRRNVTQVANVISLLKPDEVDLVCTGSMMNLCAAARPFDVL